MKFNIVIPARYNSSRFPGKPLALINGRPMIHHVCDIALAAGAKNVIVATDHSDIKSYCEDLGIEVFLSTEPCNSGTDRVALVCNEYGWNNNEIVVNLQGDEPLMPVALIHQVVSNLSFHNDYDISTLYGNISWDDNPSTVKVVLNENGKALYFSRSPIPYGSAFLKKHIGLYAYKVGFLYKYQMMEPTQLEEDERLEQLRALSYGAKIFVDLANEVPGQDINMPSDMKIIENQLKNEGN